MSLLLPRERLHICSILGGTASQDKLYCASLFILELYQPNYVDSLTCRYTHPRVYNMIITHAILNFKNSSGMTSMEEVLDIYIKGMPNVEWVGQEYMDALLHNNNEDVHSVLLNSPTPPTKSECKLCSSVQVKLDPNAILTLHRSRKCLNTRSFHNASLINSLCLTPC